MLQMERYNDSDGYYGHVYGQSEVGEEGSFVGAMVSCIAVCIIEEKGAEEGWETEY
jgi:hypothetical protein